MLLEPHRRRYRAATCCSKADREIPSGIDETAEDTDLLLKGRPAMTRRYRAATCCSKHRWDSTRYRAAICCSKAERDSRRYRPAACCSTASMRQQSGLLKGRPAMTRILEGQQTRRYRLADPHRWARRQQKIPTGDLLLEGRPASMRQQKIPNGCRPAMMRQQKIPTGDLLLEPHRWDSRRYRAATCCSKADPQIPTGDLLLKGRPGQLECMHPHPVNTTSSEHNTNLGKALQKFQTNGVKQWTFIRICVAEINGHPNFYQPQNDMDPGHRNDPSGRNAYCPSLSNHDCLSEGTVGMC